MSSLSTSESVLVKELFVSSKTPVQVIMYYNLYFIVGIYIVQGAKVLGS